MQYFSIDRSGPDPMPGGAVVRRVLAAFVVATAVAGGGLLAYATGRSEAGGGSQRPASDWRGSDSSGASHDPSVPRASAVFEGVQAPIDEPVPTF